MLENPYREQVRKTAVATVACFVVSLVLFATLGAEPDALQIVAGAVAGTVGFVLGLVLVAHVVARRRFDKLASGEALLAKWHVDDIDWARFLEVDDRESRREVKKRTKPLLIIGAVLLAVGVPLVFFDDARLAGIGFVFAGTVLFGIVGLGLWLDARLRSEQRDPSPVLVGQNGVILRQRWRAWRGLGTRLLDAAVDDEHRLLRITYEVQGRHGPVEHWLRIPIPSGREDEAKRVARALMGDVSVELVT